MEQITVSAGEFLCVLLCGQNLLERYIERGGQTSIDGRGCTHAGKARRGDRNRITTHGNPA